MQQGRNFKDDSFRRLRIASQMKEASSLIQQTVEDGTYLENSYLNKPYPLLLRVKARYDAHTRIALELFSGDESNARVWSEVEFYAAFVEPAYAYLRPEVQAGLRSPAFTLPRYEILERWAQGQIEQPTFAGDIHASGDTSRHDIVAPNTEWPDDIIRMIPPSPTSFRDFPAGNA